MFHPEKGPLMIYHPDRNPVLFADPGPDMNGRSSLCLRSLRGSLGSDIKERPRGLNRNRLVLVLL